MKITFDMETRSTVDLKQCGMHVYSRHPSTDILCVAFKADAKAPAIWTPEKFSHLRKANPSLPWVEDGWIKHEFFRADIHEAHNYGFEACMWNEIMHKRYGFEALPFDKARCSAAKAASHALPRHLEGACKALDLDQQKDSLGYKIMLKMCKPRRPTKNDPSPWHENPEEFERLCRYCMQDVEAEHALSEALYDLPDKELEVWRLDQGINNRGIKADISAVTNLMKKVHDEEQKLLLEIQCITKGRINSVRQRDVTLAWLREKGVDIVDLTKQNVVKALSSDIPPNARRLLEIRQSLAKSSVTKLKAMDSMACEDGRIRGTLLYHGASTGRWSGRGIQPHNYPRDSYAPKDVTRIVSLPPDIIQIAYGDIFQTASKCLRGMLIADEGKELFCADFSSIEARVLAWLAGESKVLSAFSEGLDVYKVTASDIYRSSYDDISADQRQIGKTAVLALGYQGWIGAFQAMAKNYGVEIPDEQAKEIILAWRDANPNIVSFWKGVESAALETVKTKEVHSYGRVKFGVRGKFMHIRLPSNRLLSFVDATPEVVTTKWGQEKEVISFMGVDTMTKKWCKQFTWGGKLTENIIQAVARDILTEAMLRLESKGYKIVFHIHDEIIAEMRNGSGGELKDFESIMSEVPSWAKGCPIKATGWAGLRYRKA